IAGAVDACGAPPYFVAIDARRDGNPGSARNAALGAFNVQIGGNGVTRPISVSEKNNLTLEAWSAVGTNLEFSLGGIPLRLRYTNHVFSTGLTCRDVPRKSCNAVDD